MDGQIGAKRRLTGGPSRCYRGMEIENAATFSPLPRRRRSPPAGLRSASESPKTPSRRTKTCRERRFEDVASTNGMLTNRSTHFHHAHSRCQLTQGARGLQVLAIQLVRKAEVHSVRTPHFWVYLRHRHAMRSLYQTKRTVGNAYPLQTVEGF